MKSFPFINKQLTVVQNRVLAISILAATISLVSFVSITPLYLIHRHYDSPLAELSGLKQRFERIIIAEEEIQTNLAKMRNAQTSQFFLKSNISALASAEIQALAEQIIESNGGKLATTSIVPINDESGYREVAVSVQFLSNIRELRQILYMLETTQPFLFIDNATFRAITRIPYVPVAGVEPEVSVQLDLTGYARMDP